MSSSIFSYAYSDNPHQSQSRRSISSYSVYTPGIGEITCFTWLDYVGILNRFRNAKALAAYAGLDSSRKMSTGKVTSTKKRGGCHILHKIIDIGADLSGLFLSGQVIDRTRCMIQTRINTTIVTYTIMDSASRRYYVDEYAPDNYHEIGDNIIIPIYVKIFRKK